MQVDKFLLVETCILFVCVEPHPVIRRCLDTLCDNAVAAVVTVSIAIYTTITERPW